LYTNNLYYNIVIIGISNANIGLSIKNNLNYKKGVKNEKEENVSTAQIFIICIFFVGVDVLFAR